MLTAHEAFAKAKKNRRRSPEMQARLSDLETLMDRGAIALPTAGEKPEMIVGCDWPSPTAGVRRAACADCGTFIGLSPDSGAAAAAKYPDVPILCYTCARRRALTT